MRKYAWLAAALWILGGGAAAGCHLVLGLETAETLDGDEQCGSAGDCDDANPCTADSCVTVCVHTPLDGIDLPREEQVDFNCLLARCSDGLVQQVPDDSDVPNDDMQCTADSCNTGMVTNTPIEGGSACSENDGKVCNANGACVECYSNADCSSPDTCGGGGTVDACGCAPTQTCTSEGLTCGDFEDQTCGGTIDCDNGTMDGAETDVDCGGGVSTCSVRCADGKSCMMGTDCASTNCVGNTCEI